VEAGGRHTSTTHSSHAAHMQHPTVPSDSKEDLACLQGSFVPVFCGVFSRKINTRCGFNCVFTRQVRISHENRCRTTVGPVDLCHKSTKCTLRHQCGTWAAPRQPRLQIQHTPAGRVILWRSDGLHGLHVSERCRIGATIIAITLVVQFSTICSRFRKSYTAARGLRGRLHNAWKS
jgi:hypothetical protein